MAWDSIPPIRRRNKISELSYITNGLICKNGGVFVVVVVVVVVVL